MVEVLPSRGFEPPTFKFTKQAARPRSFTIPPQYHDAQMQATCIYKHRCIANRLKIDLVVIGNGHIRKFDVLYS